MGLRLLANQVVACIFGVVHEGAAGRVDPVVGHDAVARGVGTSGEGRVADGRLGIRMAVVRVGVVRALFEEVEEPPFGQALPIAHGEVSAKLVDRDLHDQPRPARGLVSKELPQSGKGDEETERDCRCDDVHDAGPLLGSCPAGGLDWICILGAIRVEDASSPGLTGIAVPGFPLTPPHANPAPRPPPS